MERPSLSKRLLGRRSTFGRWVRNNLSVQFGVPRILSLERLETRTVLFAPQMFAMMPRDNSIDVPVDTNLVMKFDQPVLRGDGGLAIVKSSDNSIVKTIPVSDIAIGANWASFAVTNLAESTEYYVMAMPSPVRGVFTSLAGENFVGLSSSSDWNFTTANHAGSWSVTMVVNSLDDRPDANVGDGLALDASGYTTLRAALMEARYIYAPVQIQVPAGIYNLVTAGQGEDISELGDLDIATNVTINGDNAQSTIIDGGGLDRVFDVLPFAITKLSNLTIRNGSAVFGGGVRNQGVLTLDSVHMTNNHAGYGGALNNAGFTSITHSSFILNSAYYWGGAIYNSSAILTARNSTIGDNYTGDVVAQPLTGMGGGLLNDASGSVTLTNVTIHANRAQNYGGLVSLSASTTLKNSIVAGNSGQSRPDLLFSGNSSCLSLGHNLIGTPDEDSCFVNGNNGDQVGSLSAPLDPHLGPSGTYGGSTTVYPLLANSTAIDQGDNTGATLTDQLGKARIADGDADGIDVIDIGAVEFVSTTFIVNSVDDRRDVNLGDGNALDSTGHTTLRAAIMEANALHVPVKIQIPAGVYRLTRSGRDEDASASGDLDITDRITIIGDDAKTTIIDAAGLDRVFDVLPGAKTLLSQLTIRNGDATIGGGIRNQGTLELDKANLTENRASTGGAIYATGPTSITNSSLVANLASVGAAFYNQGAILTALNSTIGNNQAYSAGGGLVSDSGGTVTLTSVTVYANSAPSTGGLAALNSSTIKLKNSIVAGNLGGNYPDLYNASASFLSLGHNLIGNPADVVGFVNGTNGDQVGSSSQLLNPHLGSSGTYGGSTVVYPLLASSPGIDHGDNAGAPTTDQSGKARITDGDDDGVDVIDIGAVELAVQTFVVNSLDDLPDAFLGDGLAVDFTGHTTLRAAIMEANAVQGHTRILVPAGNVLIYLGQGDDTAAYGDLDIATSITIVGADAKSTIIDGGGWDRIFHVLPDATAKLSNLTVRNGSNNYGGGVLNQGTLELDRVNLTENHASTGGAIYSVGLTSISNSSLIKNFANNAGAVYNYAAKFTASNSTIGENEASSFAGGLASENGTNVTLTNVTVYANKAPSAGGLAAGYSDTVSLKNSIVAGNLGGNYPDLFSSYSTYISLGHNLIGNPADVPAFVNGTDGDQVGSNTLPLNPHLGSSGTYGGSTVVYPLLASSPAIDQGDNAGAAITDQSGKARITDGDDDGTDVIDIGSVEYVSPTMVVNSFEDNPDVLPGDGFALDLSGHTTLRAAIMEANSRQGPVKIRVPAGIYTLTVNGRDEDMSVLGDMDLATNVKIVGDDAKTTIIDGNGLDRIFHVLPGAKADISKLTMRHGDVRHYSDKGGGVFNQGTLTLDSVVLIENRATYGGAILSEGVVTITGSSLIKNNAFVAGAFYNSGGVLTALNSTVGENQASSGGAMLIDNGKVELTNVTIYANESSAAGGLAAFNTSTITLRNSIVAGNLGGAYPDLYNLNSRYQSLGHNLIGNPANVFGFVNGTLGDQVGSGSFPIDPHLGPSGTYGGSTVIYPLLARSTAIDHGDHIGATATDQSGKARVMDGDDDGTSIIDIGAVEFTSQTIIVNSLDDYPDLQPGDGFALDVSGHTTLRAAIMEANTREVPVKVRVPAGIYVLANTGQEDDMSAMGDLDIATNVKIIGADAKTTIIDGGGAYRVFQVLPGASAELSNLTIRNGNAWFSEGGGVRNQGTLALDRVNLTDNRANVGGALYTDGLTTISNSSFVKNVANIAGAIQNDAAVLTMTNSTIGENIANNGGGGLVTEHGGDVTLFSLTVYANSASIAGGLAVLGASTITIRNSIVAGNIGGNYPDLYNDNSNYLSLGHNLIGNPAGVLGFINGINGDLVGNSFSQLNPRLGSAGTYGGSTTIYPLLLDSLAIDHGDNAGANAIDQSGKNRIIDGDEDGLEVIDIGAAEFEQWTLVVDSFDDLPDAFLGDGHALDVNGHTTLRAAIMEANALHVQTKIQVPAGNYIHSYTGLDIATSITIVGEDAESTIINGGGWDRVFHIESGANAKLSNLTIRNGYAAQGGGILNQGTLVLDKVNLTDNRANTGGAIYSVGPTSITNSSLVNNFASVAGAVFNLGVNLTASNSTIGENIATDRGGGLVNQNGGEVTLINVTVYANKAPEAGGIATFNTGVVSLRNSIVAGNFGGYYADLYNVNASYVSLGHNLIGNPAEVPVFINGVQGDLVGTYYAPLDPQLGPSGIYSGSTVVYPPVAGSQAIDHVTMREPPSLTSLVMSGYSMVIMTTQKLLTLVLSSLCHRLSSLIVWMTIPTQRQAMVWR